MARAFIERRGQKLREKSDVAEHHRSGLRSAFATLVSFLRALPYARLVDFVRPVEAVVGGTRGRLLAALANVTAPLTLRRLAGLADVSPAQASRVLPQLVELGIVDRREVPPASEFLLVRDHVAAKALLALADVHAIALEEFGNLAGRMTPPPVSVIVFGSFARREAHTESDIDLMIVRADDADEHDDRWPESVEAFRRSVRALTGNETEIIETTRADASEKLERGTELWRQIERDGVVVYGVQVNDFTASPRG